MTSELTPALATSFAAEMTSASDGAPHLARSPGAAPARRSQVVPSAVLAMLIFVFTEVMFFTGLVSAFLITRASIGPSGWPPANQPRLPVAMTAVNTVALLLSAVALWFAWRALRSAKPGAMLRLGAAIALGACFLIGQGREWVALIHEGLTLHSSIHGSFFYIIVGCHGLHALAALLSLGWAGWRLRTGQLHSDTLAAISVFWFFVVGVWPFLYYEIYL